MKRKPTEKHTNWNLLVSVLSTEWLPLLLHHWAWPHHRKSKGQVHPYSVLQAVFTEIDSSGTSCCGKWTFTPSTGLPWWLQPTACAEQCSPPVLLLPWDSNAPLIDRMKLMTNMETLTQKEIPNRLLHFIPGAQGRRGSAAGLPPVVAWLLSSLACLESLTSSSICYNVVVQFRARHMAPI